MTTPRPNKWRETVRDIYDNLHFAKREGLPELLVAMIEKRHHGYFAAERELDNPPAAGPIPAKDFDNAHGPRG